MGSRFAASHVNALTVLLTFPAIRICTQNTASNAKSSSTRGGVDGCCATAWRTHMLSSETSFSNNSTGTAGLPATAERTVGVGSTARCSNTLTGVSDDAARLVLVFKSG